MWLLVIVDFLGGGSQHQHSLLDSGWVRQTGRQEEPSQDGRGELVPLMEGWDGEHG